MDYNGKIKKCIYRSCCVDMCFFNNIGSLQNNKIND